MNYLSPWNWFKDEDENRKFPGETAKHDFLPSFMLSEMSRFFDDTNGKQGRNGHLTSVQSNFTPLIDIQDRGDEYCVKAELPGVEKKDVHVSIENGRMLITGEKKQEREEKGNNYYRKESSYGSFERRLNLPENIAEDKVKAKFDNGILTVRLAKDERKNSVNREISIS